MDQYDEQHILERLTAWWARWGKWLLCLLAVTLMVVAGVSGWKYWQHRQTARAAVLYEQLQPAISLELATSSTESTEKKETRITRIATDLENRFGRTPYAQMGALAAAKALYQAADVQAAKAQLRWAAEAAIDAEYRQIARLRLAAVLLEEKAYDAALRILGSTPSTPAFAALHAQQRGDVLAAQGQREQARAAYQDALQFMDTKNTAARQLVQVKLDALGDQSHSH